MFVVTISHDLKFQLEKSSPFDIFMGFWISLLRSSEAGCVPKSCQGLGA